MSAWSIGMGRIAALTTVRKWSIAMTASNVNLEPQRWAMNHTSRTATDRDIFDRDHCPWLPHRGASGVPFAMRLDELWSSVLETIASARHVW